MNIKTLKAKIEMYGEIEELMDMVDDTTQARLAIAELQYRNNPEALSNAKIEIFANAIIEINRLKDMLVKVRDA